MVTNIRIRPAQPGDASDISRLISDCFGDSYPYRSLFEVHSLAKRLADRDLLYALAEAQDKDGPKLVGQMSIQRKNPFGLYEIGGGVVDVDYRSRGIMGAMGRLLLDELARNAGVAHVVGYSVTNHAYTHRYTRSSGFTPLGLLLGHCPDLSMRGIAESTQPISTVVVGRRLAATKRPRHLALTGPDRTRALRALSALGIPVVRGVPRRRRPLGCRTSRTEFGLRLQFGDAGGDTPVLGFSDVEAERGTQVIWADVPISHPQAPAILERLRADGLGFGAFLPVAGLDGEDILRLQRYLAPDPLDPAIILVLDDCEELKADVLADCGLTLVEAAA